MSWFKKKVDVDKSPVEGVDSVISGLKSIYHKKIEPVEKMYDFQAFHSPLMQDGDFDSKPMVLFLGQYSTGKTTFIEYLLERSFPGAHIGPEPTTDRFCAIQFGAEERVIPGNALAVQADQPYRGLQQFGTSFLNRFQGSTCNCPLLENFTFIDTPGVLSGEKQRIARGYEFTEVITWFASRADMILLLFDAHKLDISDEFKEAIQGLKGNEEKVRIVLNKADRVNGQQLMRVYGALMWSLGKVFLTPEVSRVYIGSFWAQPYQCTDNATLFDAEREDLFRDLLSLPRGSALRKVNELVKRARLARVHALIIGHLRAEMPAMFGKESKQKELIKNLAQEFQKVQQKYQIPVGDFPELNKFRNHLSACDFSKFNKLNEQLVKAMDDVLAADIPKLMRMFPEHAAPSANAERSADNWLVTPQRQERYTKAFDALAKDEAGNATAAAAKAALVASGLPFETLGKIWEFSDFDKRGALDRDEFCVAMYLVDECASGKTLPSALPPLLVPPSRRTASTSSNPFA